MALTEKYCNCDLTTGANDGSSEANAWQTLAAAFSGLAAGQRLNVKRTASPIDEGGLTFSTSATATAPIHIRGYTSTIGDGGLFQYADYLVVSGAAVLLEGLDIDVSTYADYALKMSGGDQSCAYRCKIKSTKDDGEALSLIAGSAVNCYIETTGASSLRAVYLLRANLLGCLIKAKTKGIEVDCSYRTSAIVGNSILGPANTGTSIGIELFGMTIAPGLLVSSNSIDRFADGINFPAFPDVGDDCPAVVINNVIYDVVNGINNADTTPVRVGVHFFGNAIGGASGNRYNGLGDLPLPGDITLTANPFTDPTSLDFSLNSAAGGGALCRGLAIPTKYSVDGSIDNWLDVGAHQREVTGGGGSGGLGHVIGGGVVR